MKEEPVDINEVLKDDKLIDQLADGKTPDEQPLTKKLATWRDESREG